MKYSTATFNSIKYRVNTADLFAGFNLKELEVSRKLVKKTYSNGTDIRLWCCRIFIYILYLVILDIIKNNTIFVFSSNREMVLSVEIIKGKQLLEELKNSKSDMYDYFSSEFKLPRLKIFFKKSSYGVVNRGVLLNYSLTKQFFENINKGNLYG